MKRTLNKNKKTISLFKMALLTVAASLSIATNAENIKNDDSFIQQNETLSNSHISCLDANDCLSKASELFDQHKELSKIIQDPRTTPEQQLKLYQNATTIMATAYQYQLKGFDMIFQ